MDEPLQRQATRFAVQRHLIGRISVALVLVTAVTYVGVYAGTQRLLMYSIEEQAESFVDFIVKSRVWNARYGGVYVHKSPGVTTNPYLEELGVQADVELADGTLMTLRNPELMSREISELLARESGVTYHLTSLEPVNPENSPDEWESLQLAEFEQGMRENGEVVSSGHGEPRYRYMRALIVENACLRCHATQGYKIGEVRGGVSVSIPIGRVRTQLVWTALGLAAIVLLILTTLLVMMRIIAARVVDRLEIAEQRLEELAVTDPLTGVWNRRYTMQRLTEEFDRSRRTEEPLGLIMLDLDHFKSINDRFGHALGDLVLKAAAQRMHKVTREYDTLGRFGGEEFLVIAPGSRQEDVVKLAERIRHEVSSEPVAGSGTEITFTTSAGVAMLARTDLTPDAVLARADAALYAAKKAGRDRVIFGQPHHAREHEPPRRDGSL